MNLPNVLVVEEVEKWNPEDISFLIQLNDERGMKNEYFQSVERVGVERTIRRDEGDGSAVQSSS